MKRAINVHYDMIPREGRNRNKSRYAKSDTILPIYFAINMFGTKLILNR